MATLLISAFWHGFYPFYYFMFAQAAMLVECAKEIYRARIFFDWIPDPYHYMIANFMSTTALNYLGILFALLTFENGFRFMSSMWYLWTIMMPAFLIFSKVFGLVPMAKKLEKKRQAKEMEKGKKDL